MCATAVRLRNHRLLYFEANRRAPSIVDPQFAAFDGTFSNKLFSAFSLSLHHPFYVPNEMWRTGIPKPLLQFMISMNTNENMTYTQRVAAMKPEFDSQPRKNQVHPELHSLTLTSFISGRGIKAEDQQLNDMIIPIHILHPQVPAVFSQMRSNCATFVIRCFNVIGLMLPRRT